MLTQKELEAIKERCDNATEEPWDFVPVLDEEEFYLYSKGEKDGVAERVFVGEDAVFIANSREDIPKLLNEIERLKSKLALIERKALAPVGAGIEYVNTTVCYEIYLHAKEDE